MGTHAILVAAVCVPTLSAALASGAAPARRSLVPPVFLPNGSEFTTWEQPFRFANTLHVAREHPRADDANPGTESLPFKTINAAAQAAQPGDRVLVHKGVYREWVRPARGGSGPVAMIHYEAAEGESVAIKGSEAVDPESWRPSWLRTGKETVKAAAELWMLPLDPARFAPLDAFAQINRDGRPNGFWFPAYRLRRGLVFQDGHRLEQVYTCDELLAARGRYWVEDTAAGAVAAADAASPPAKPAARYVLHVRPRAGSSLAQSRLEITLVALYEMRHIAHGAGAPHFSEEGRDGLEPVSIPR